MEIFKNSIEPTPISGMASVSRPQLRSRLQSMDVQFPEKSRKAELMELLRQEHTKELMSLGKYNTVSFGKHKFTPFGVVLEFWPEY